MCDTHTQLATDPDSIYSGFGIRREFSISGIFGYTKFSSCVYVYTQHLIFKEPVETAHFAR
jgi:hypothetical protein